MHHVSPYPPSKLYLDDPIKPSSSILSTNIPSYNIPYSSSNGIMAKIIEVKWIFWIWSFESNTFFNGLAMSLSNVYIPGKIVSQAMTFLDITKRQTPLYSSHIALSDEPTFTFFIFTRDTVDQVKSFQIQSKMYPMSQIFYISQQNRCHYIHQYRVSHIRQCYSSVHQLKKKIT